MSTEHRTLAEIEHDIARNRAQIASQIEHLQGRVAPAVLVEHAKTFARSNVSDLIGPISKGARQNPLAVLLIGVGAVWLAMGKKEGRGRPAVAKPEPQLPYARVQKQEWLDDGGAVWTDDVDAGSSVERAENLPDWMKQTEKDDAHVR